MNRIVVSPKAVALATLLWDEHLEHRLPGGLTSFLAPSDVEAADQLGLALDTVYRAYVEPQRLGAVDLGRVDRNTGRRHVAVHYGHWLFTALKQEGVVALRTEQGL